MQNSGLSRRAWLSVIGTSPLGMFKTEAKAGQTEEGQYSLLQGERCEPIQPIRGRLPVESFYDYQLPEKYVSDENGASIGSTVRYSSAGTQEFQRPQTSIMFLYNGPSGLSLVIVHGDVEPSEGGSVTFRLTGLPTDGKWVVKDDRYRNPDTGEIASSNYDHWQVDGSEHRIDWTWGSTGTDGGVFRSLGDEFELVIHPAFNEDAALYDEHYEGTVTDWEFLSGSVSLSKRIPLSLENPIQIRADNCRDIPQSSKGNLS